MVVGIFSTRNAFFLLLGFFAVRTCIAMFAPQTKEEKDKPDDTSLYASLKEKYYNIFDVNGKYKMYPSRKWAFPTSIFIIFIMMPVEISLFVCATLSIQRQ